MLSNASFSLQYFEGKVTLLEPTYMPQAVAFKMDSGNSACPAGAQLKWSKPDTENNLVTYSTLLAAFMSEKRVRFYIDNDDTTCQGQYLHLLNN